MTQRNSGHAVDQNGERVRLSGRYQSRLLTLDDLADLPEPRYLLHDFIRADGTNVLYGPSGSGKSFAALDWNLCIASGRPFFGRAVDQGPTVYIAAEGVSGYYKRAQAWCLARGVEYVSDFRIFPEAVNFFSGETAALEAAFAVLKEPPVLITIDTMARCMVGGEENSAKDVGLFIDTADKLAKQLGSALLIVHHTGRNGELERGSTALRGAADTMLSLKPEGASVKLTCEKQKDAAKFDALRFHLEAKSESCVIRPGGDVGRLPDHQEKILETVPSSFGTEWFSQRKIGGAAGLSKSTTQRGLKALVARGSIEERTIGTQKKEYRLKPDQAAVPGRPKRSLGTAETVPSHTPLLGVGQATGAGPDK
ncbi:MAG: AAA family ATPase [Solirubrobacterales bacterium]|nr:AAA family ATPase [Solirubrobacterales bacterium]